MNTSCTRFQRINISQKMRVSSLLALSSYPCIVTISINSSPLGTRGEMIRIDILVKRKTDKKKTGFPTLISAVGQGQCNPSPFIKHKYGPYLLYLCSQICFFFKKCQLQFFAVSYNSLMFNFGGFELPYSVNQIDLFLLDYLVATTK